MYAIECTQTFELGVTFACYFFTASIAEVALPHLKGTWITDCALLALLIVVAQLSY